MTDPIEPDPELTERVQRLVSRVILECTGVCVEPAPDDPLIQRGHLDSLSMVNLVLAIQSEFAVDLDVTDLNEQNFGSVRTITGLIAARLQ